jgi:hypothetical protein
LVWLSCRIRVIELLTLNLVYEIVFMYSFLVTVSIFLMIAGNEQ